MDIEKETFSSCNRASKSQPLSQKQKDTLIEYVYARPDMYKGTFSPTFTYATSVMLWKQVADILNSIPGSKKDWKQWRKTFVDIKKNAKSKLSKQKKHSQGTGEGPPLKDDYPKEDTNTDTKILEIITPVAIDGNKDVPIRQTFDYTENDASTDIKNIEIDDKREDQPGTSKAQSTPKKPHTLINVTKSRSIFQV